MYDLKLSSSSIYGLIYCLSPNAQYILWVTMNLGQRLRPLLRINNAFKSHSISELLGQVERDPTSRAHYKLSAACVLCWETIPINVQTTGKGLCD